MLQTIQTNTNDAWLLDLCSQLAYHGLPADIREVYRGRNLVAAYKPQTLDCEVNIKSVRRPGFIKSAIYGWLRPSKARRSYEYSLRLLELGVATPQPYAFIEDLSAIHTLRRSYYISMQLDSQWHEIRYMEERSDYPAMVEALGKWVAEVHSKGVLVKDLSPGNILFRLTAQGGYDFCLVDVNRMGFGCHNLRRQLYRAGWLMNSEASSADFARHYARAAGIDAAQAEQIVLDSYRRLQRRAARKKRKSLFRP